MPPKRASVASSVAKATLQPVEDPVHESVPAPLKSLDLFTGIGGFTRALEGIATPAMYCEWAKECQGILLNRMVDGLLPTAPICRDVRLLSKENFPELEVDLIVGGFPCVGFSPFGKRQGFQDSESGLFREIVRITDEFAPKMLFLENVPELLSCGGIHGVIEAFTSRGYSLRWCVLPASAVGAPHERKRWFCLVVKGSTEGTEAIQDLLKGIDPVALSSYQAASWAAEPDRMSMTPSATGKWRLATLGNSLVPDAARAAFLHLMAAGRRPVHTLAPKSLALEPTDPDILTRVPRTRSNVPRHGWVDAPVPTEATTEDGAPTEDDAQPTISATISATIRGLPEPILTFVPPAARLRLIMDPAVYAPPNGSGTNALRTAERITTATVMPHWATPRHGMLGACHILSSRSIRDLPTQVRFEKGTPDDVRTGQLRSEFVEWMMGYPQGWTTGIAMPPTATETPLVYKV